MFHLFEQIASRYIRWVTILFEQRFNSRDQQCTVTSKINGTPKGVYLPISKLHSILAVANLLAHNNKSQICYCGQISLQSAAVNCTFSYNLTPLGYHLFCWLWYTYIHMLNCSFRILFNLLWLQRQRCIYSSFCELYLHYKVISAQDKRHTQKLTYIYICSFVTLIDYVQMWQYSMILLSREVHHR